MSEFQFDLRQKRRMDSYKNLILFPYKFDMDMILDLKHKKIHSLKKTIPFHETLIFETQKQKKSDTKIGKIITKVFSTFQKLNLLNMTVLKRIIAFQLEDNFTHFSNVQNKLLNI